MRGSYSLGAKLIFVRKTVLLQRLGDSVRSGYTRWVGGELAADQVDRVARKLMDAYETQISRATKSRRLAAGRAKAELLLYVHPPRPGEPLRVAWFLLTSPGALPPGGERERWRDAEAKLTRLRFDSYELVRMTKPGEARPVWTWRIEADKLEGTRQHLIVLIRQRQDAALRQAIYSISRMPGFAGVRRQVVGLRRLITTEWQRRRGTDEMPPLPKGVGYVQRVADGGIALDDWPAAVKHWKRTGKLPGVREQKVVGRDHVESEPPAQGEVMPSV